LNWGEEHNFSGAASSNLMPSYPPVLSTGITMPFYVQPDTFIAGVTLAIPVIPGEMGWLAEVRVNPAQQNWRIPFLVSFNTLISN